jgi:hypothetical protein
VIMLGEKTSLPNIPNICKHMCSLRLIARLSLVQCGWVRAREYLTAQRLADNTASTNRFVDSNYIQRLHDVSSCSMTPQWAATTPHTSASDVRPRYTGIPSPCHLLHLPSSATATRLETLSRVSFVFPVLSFSPCNTIRLAAGSDNACFSLRRYIHSNLFV